VGYSLRTGGLVRLLAFAAVAWAPAMIALAAHAAGVLALPGAAALGGTGMLAASALAVRRALRHEAPRFREGAATGDGAAAGASWERVARPDGQYANRWASYHDLSAWLGARDWTGKVVVEFGHTNDVLRAFIRGARYAMLEYPQHDVQDLRGVPDAGFDLAILDQTLEHVADPERALREVRRVLRPGGVAIISTPFLVPLHPTADYGDYTRWTPQGMKAMLERNGFDADVRWWGNADAARALLGAMHMTVAEARRLGLNVEPGACDEPFPVTVWALATARA